MNWKIPCNIRSVLSLSQLLYFFIHSSACTPPWNGNWWWWKKSEWESWKKNCINNSCLLCAYANRQWIKKIHSISDLGSQVVINDSHERFIMKAKEPIFQFSAGGLHERPCWRRRTLIGCSSFFFPVELLTSDAITVKIFIPSTLNTRQP